MLKTFEFDLRMGCFVSISTYYPDKYLFRFVSNKLLDTSNGVAILIDSLNQKIPDILFEKFKEFLLYIGYKEKFAFNSNKKLPKGFCIDLYDNSFFIYYNKLFNEKCNENYIFYNEEDISNL